MKYMVNPSNEYRLQFTEIKLNEIINEYVYFWEDNSVVGKKLCRYRVSFIYNEWFSYRCKRYVLW